MPSLPTVKEAPTLVWDCENRPEQFRIWRRKVELILETHLDEVEDSKKAKLIQLWLNDDAFRALEGLNLTVAQLASPTEILDKLQTRVEPVQTFRAHRYQLMQLKQGNQEPVDDYVQRLRKEATQCKFKTQENDRILDTLIFGCNNRECKETLISKDEKYSLEDAVKHIREAEAIRAQMSQINKPSGSVDGLQRKTSSFKKSCGKCGTKHVRAKCPAFGKICNQCGKKNHYASVCREGTRPNNQKSREHTQDRSSRWNKRSQSRVRDSHAPKVNHSSRVPYERKPIHHLTDQYEYEDSDIREYETPDISFTDSLTCDSVTSQSLTTKVKLIETIRGKSSHVNFKIDSGSDSNTLPIKHFRRAFPHLVGSDGNPSRGILERSYTQLTAYGGSSIKHIGTIDLDAVIAPLGGTEKKRRMTFFVTDVPGPPLLGCPDSKAAGLIKIMCAVGQRVSFRSDKYIHPSTPLKERPPIPNKEILKEMYPECFDGVGCFENFTYHISLKEDCTPVVHGPRKIPVHIQPLLEKELEKMERDKIIIKVFEPTDWVNSLVVCPKGDTGQIRVCLDPKDLNKAIKRPLYPTPTLEDLGPKLANSTIFSKLDARHGYWNILLDHSSSLLTTFNTHKGRYRFLRLPFGLNVSQDIFQRKIDETYERALAAKGFADDIKVWGDYGNHDQHLHDCMELTRKAGVKLNFDKCQIRTKECEFFGNIYTPEGVKPDPEKVRAIRQMKPPEDKKALQSFLGMVTYLGPYIEHMSEYTAPLRELTRLDTQYVWKPEHTKAFEELKSSISAETTLAYYNPQKELVLETDASGIGLGATIKQDGRPIAFASKALSDTEKRYATIEKECLAVVFGCKKFHHYIYARPVTVHTDHKPLPAIFKKNISSAPTRLQRLVHELTRYNIAVEHRPGKTIPIADCLSRVSPLEDEGSTHLTVNIHAINPVGPVTLSKIKTATALDSDLQLLQQQIVLGWPEYIKKLDPSIRSYWSVRDSLSIENGVAMMGNRIVIPAELQKSILMELHNGHPGYEKTKLKAQETVYWPGLYKQIEDHVSKCRPCQVHANSQPKEQMIPSEPPPRPWHTVGADLFFSNQTWFLMIVDYYSKFFFIRKLSSQSAASVVKATKGIFSEQGIPEKLISDNGGCFASTEFSRFSDEYSFKLVTSSPHHPKGHGLVERHIQTAKRIMQKCQDDGSDIELALLHQRITPISWKTPSPAELLQGRKFRSTLPSRISPPRNAEIITTQFRDDSAKSKDHYDKSAQHQPDLLPNQNVFVQHPQTHKWQEGKVIGSADTPRSYKVQLADTGQILRRNRAVLKRSAIKDGHTYQPKQQQIPTRTPEPLNPQITQPQAEVKAVPPITNENASQPTSTLNHAPTPTPQINRTRFGRESKPPKRFGND